jgi:hypothetical protein
MGSPLRWVKPECVHHNGKGRILAYSFSPIRSGLFVLAYSFWPIRSGPGCTGHLPRRMQPTGGPDQRPSHDGEY